MSTHLDLPYPTLPEGGDVIEALMESGAVAPAQVSYAQRVRSKLRQRRPVLSVLRELGELDDGALNAALREQREHLRLGSLLVELDLLSEGDLAAAVSMQAADVPSRPLVEVLSRQGLLDEDGLMRLWTQRLGYETFDGSWNANVADLTGKQVEAAWCRRHLARPVAIESARTVIACANPLSKAMRNAAVELFGEAIELRPAPCTALLARMEPPSADTDEKKTVSPEIEQLIELALRSGASDVLFEPANTDGDLQMRWRVAGRMSVQRRFDAAASARLLSQLERLLAASPNGQYAAESMELQAFGRVAIGVQSYTLTSGKHVFLRLPAPASAVAP